MSTGQLSFFSLLANTSDKVNELLLLKDQGENFPDLFFKLLTFSLNIPNHQAP